MSRKVELTEEYFTNDGSKVVIYTVDAGGEFPVHAGVIGKDKKMFMQNYSIHGTVPDGDGEHPKDIKFPTELEPGQSVMCMRVDELVPSFGIISEIGDRVLCNVCSENGTVVLKEFDFVVPVDVQDVIGKFKSMKVNLAEAVNEFSPIEEEAFTVTEEKAEVAGLEIGDLFEVIQTAIIEAKNLSNKKV